MQLFIKTFDGKTSISLEVDANVTGEAVRNLIRNKTGFNTEIQQLIVKGKVWEGNTTLAETKYDIDCNFVHLRCHFPRHLKELQHIKFQEMKSFSLDLACHISQTTRVIRYSLENTPDTDYYWDHLDGFKRYDLLTSDGCWKIIKEAQKQKVMDTQAQEGWVNCPMM